MRRITRRLAALALAAAVSLSATLGVAAPALAYTEYDVLTMAGHGVINPSYLVVHSTANPGATAKNHVDYWNRVGNGSSMAHWVIDWTGICYQIAPADRLVYHVGYGNRYSVGIEICEATNASDFERGYDEAAKWCADFLRSRGWGVSRMVSHNEARTLWGGTDHTDPVPYFTRWGRSWADFESRVQWYLDHGTGSGAPSSTGGSSGSGSQQTGQSTGAKVGSNLPGGTYRVNCDALNIRAGHSTSSADVGTYYRGQTVVLDSTYYVDGGYVWGTYIAYSGNRRYVAVGPATGSVEPDDYLLRVGGSSSSSGRPASGSQTWRVGAKVKVTKPYDENGTRLAVSGTYTIMEIRGNRVVIGRAGVVTAALSKSSLKLA